MFSASRVFSFTAGTLGMLGGVLGSLFHSRAWHAGYDRACWAGLAGRRGARIVTEIVACGRCSKASNSTSMCCRRWRWR